MKKKITTILLVFTITITSFFSTCINSYANPLALFLVSEELYSLIVGLGIAGGAVLTTQQMQDDFVNLFIAKTCQSGEFTTSPNGTKEKFPTSTGKADSGQYTLNSLEKLARRTVKKDGKKLIPTPDFIKFFNKINSGYHEYPVEKDYNFGSFQQLSFDKFTTADMTLSKVKKLNKPHDYVFIQDFSIPGSPYSVRYKIYYQYYDWMDSFSLMLGDNELSRMIVDSSPYLRLCDYDSKTSTCAVRYVYEWCFTKRVPCMNVHDLKPLKDIPESKKIEIDSNKYKPSSSGLIGTTNENFGDFQPVDTNPNKPTVTDPPKSDIDFNFDWHKLDLNNFNLKNKFPFSIPWDLSNIIKVFDVTPKVPKFDLTFMGGTLMQVDFSQFDEPISLFRFFETLIYMVALMFLTKKII